MTVELKEYGCMRVELDECMSVDMFVIYFKRKGKWK